MKTNRENRISYEIPMFSIDKSYIKVQLFIILILIFMDHNGSILSPCLRLSVCLYVTHSTHTQSVQVLKEKWNEIKSDPSFFLLLLCYACLMKNCCVSYENEMGFRRVLTVLCVRIAIERECEYEILILWYCLIKIGFSTFRNQFLSQHTQLTLKRAHTQQPWKHKSKFIIVDL